MHRNGYKNLLYILYNSKFSTTSKFLGTNVAFVKRVHCISVIISILIIIIMIIAKIEGTALAFIFEVFTFIDWLFQNSLTFPWLLLKFQNSLTNFKIPWQFPDLEKIFFSLTFSLTVDTLWNVQ